MQVYDKADAQWTYKGNKSYMPMVGHIAQTGQIVATDFRAGNVSPNTDNLAKWVKSGFLMIVPIYAKVSQR
jgi:hypothetical protein